MSQQRSPEGLARLAQETLAICERGTYVAPSGRTVRIGDAVQRAIAGTVLFRPGGMYMPKWPRVMEAAGPRMTIEVTEETTGAAARRVAKESPAHVVALNFASAKNPGGGFLRGTTAQEEDLARCSALYPCLLPQRVYYEANRASLDAGALYTDHLIYSPDVPFFRDERLNFLEEPFLVSMVTAPAPNAGAELARDPGAGPRIREAMERRAELVLRVMAAQGHRVALLGAWGCGVFRNDPAQVAAIFAALLGGRYRHAFYRVVFPVYDKSPGQVTLRAFRDALQAQSVESKS